jgi:DNA-binding transcriptional LysR family regulator
MSFDGRLLSGVTVLAAVVAGGSFVNAAEALGLSASGVSRAIGRLEARVGVRLLDRTTRSLRLTDEGTRFYQQVVPLLGGIEEAAAALSGASASVRGRLRVGVEPFFSRLVLAPHLGDFIARHPGLELDLITSDEMGDLVAQGLDVAIRFGPPPSSVLVARHLLDTRILTVAAPRYLEQHSRPETPEDLARHACIQFRDPRTGRPFGWEFHAGPKVLSVETSGPLTVSDVGTMLGACLAGAGIAQVMALGVQELLARGELIELFPDWPDETFPLYALYASRHHPPAKLRAFMEFCAEAIR